MWHVDVGSSRRTSTLIQSNAKKKIIEKKKSYVYRHEKEGKLGKALAYRWCIRC